MPRTASTRLLPPPCALPCALAAALACSAGGGGDKTSAGGAGGTAGLGGTGGGVQIDAGGGSGGGGGLPVPSCSSGCLDFPEQPIFEDGAPSDAADLFGPPDPAAWTGTPPCVLEPQLSQGETPGAMLPPNWLRPRFRFTAEGNLFEIRVTAPSQKHALVAYTTTPLWKMPEAIWQAAAANNAGKPMSVMIRALDTASPATQSGVQGDLSIAPVNAGGSLVFWTVKDSNVGPDSSKLYGFSVGDEGVIEVLAPKSVVLEGMIHENGVDLRGEYGGAKPGFDPGEVQCIGCHASTPDGESVVFTDDWPWNKAIASVKEGEAGQVPSYLSPGGRALLKMPWLGTQSMSKAHWQDGDRVLVASYGQRADPFSSSSGENDRLAWIDLETGAAIDDSVPGDPGLRQAAKDARNQAILAAQGTAWDVLAMNGESASAVTPDFASAGDRVVYVSTDDSPNGHPSYEAQRADLMLVPWNDGAGGDVAPLAGAAEPAFLEYYPTFSEDDRLIAFTRAPRKHASGADCPGSSCPDGPYYNRHGAIHVIPSDGGVPVRLIANDPVACAGDDASAGLINSWPKWSPHATAVEGKTYYFLIFSSARVYPGQFEIPRGQYTPQTLDTRSSQLYMAAIVVDDASGEVTTHPAVYLWNQNSLVGEEGVTELANSNLTPAWDDFVIPHVPPIPR